MTVNIAVAALALFALAGCASPKIATAKRDSRRGSRVTTRCERVDMKNKERVNVRPSHIQVILLHRSSDSNGRTIGTRGEE
jgi:hypothetical protein